jgi:hypothetical protein
MGLHKFILKMCCLYNYANKKNSAYEIIKA